MTYVSLTQGHWDVIEYPRDAWFNHNGEQPNNRAILKAMQDKWSGPKVHNKTQFDLFLGNPSKQAGKVAGLPESMRKGGTRFRGLVRGVFETAHDI